MDFTLRHKKDGTPYVSIYMGENKITGKQIRPYREFKGMTDEQARVAAASWIAQLEAEYAGNLSNKLGERLERYLTQLDADGRSSNTVAAYRTFVGYCKPIASMPVPSITPLVLNDLYTLLLNEGAHGTALSQSTVHSFKMFLQGAFKSFVNEGIIAHNPVGDSMRINTTRKEAEALDEQSLRAVSEYLDRSLSERPDTNTGILRRNAAFGVYLALYTGARAGELCALRRQDIKLFSRTMSINGTVVHRKGGPQRQNKTKGKRNRNIAILERCVEPIRDHLRWQEEYLAGTPTSSTPILTTDGSWLSPIAVSHQFSRMRRELGLPNTYHLHTLRHTHATWLLQHGTDMRTVQERLGHARVDTTLQLYGHVLPGRDRQAAEDFGRIMDEITAW